MATIRRYWRCTNTDCKNERGKHRGYKKVSTGEKREKTPLCKHCQQPMVLSENYSTRITRDGKEHRRSVSPRKSDAETHLAACVVARRTGDLFPGEEPMISWQDAVDGFNKHLDTQVEKKELSPNTAKYYRDNLKTLEKVFGKANLQDIEMDAVALFHANRLKEVSASWANGALVTLKRLYTVTCMKKKARKYPHLHEAMVDILKVKPQKLDNANEVILDTQEEIDALLAECASPHLYHFCFGIFNTGLRHRDMLKLKKSEISFDRDEITTIVKGHRGGKQVRIKLTDEYRAYLKEWIRNQKVRSINDYLIPSKVNPSRCYKTDSNIGFDTACERAAKKFEAAGRKDLAEKFRTLKPHMLRHTFATHYLYKTSKEYGATAAIHELSKILGHSSVYITQRYSHVLDEISREAMKNFGNQMFGGE